MHCFVGEIETERFVAVGLLLKKLNGLSRYQSRNVTVLRNPFAVIVDRILVIRRIVLTLTFEAEPVVKAWTRVIIGVPHVPFTDESRRIASVLQVLREKQGAVGDRTLVVDDAVAKPVKK